MVKATADVRKQVWKFQESVVVIALLECGFDRSDISWHEKKLPDGMSIEPDVVVTENGKLKLILFVTHASCEHGADKKFWRGVAEVVEAKRLSTHPRLVNVLFSGETKKNLSLLNEELFDGCLHLSETGYGRELTDGLYALAQIHGSGSTDECFDILSRLVKSKQLKGFTTFKKQLQLAIGGKFGPYHKRLCSSKFSLSTSALVAQRTAYRRGLTKLFTLPQSVRTELYLSKNPKNVPEHALAMGWFVKTISNARLDDEDLAWVVRHIPRDVSERIVVQAENSLPAFVQYSQTINEMGVLRLANEWIVESYETLSEKSGMENALISIFRSPKKPLEKFGLKNQSVVNHWLLSSIISMLRTETGRADGYGYSKLGQETGRRRELNAFAGTIMAPYLQLKCDIDSGLRSDIAKVLSGHINRLGVNKCKELLDKSVSTTIDSIFSYQLSGYRNFNPVQWEIEKLLQSEGVNYICPVAHKSFLSTDESGISSTTGNLICVNEGSIFIKCQSAYDGRVDKRKELCGRIGAMKLSYTEQQLKSVKFYIVIDGYFDQNDIELLSKAGWDGIYYPHELSTLVFDLKSFLKKKN